jgi:hypothetical protein
MMAAKKAAKAKAVEEPKSLAFTVATLVNPKNPYSWALYFLLFMNLVPLLKQQ